MIAQRHLNLSISNRTVLVTGDMVRAALGVDADTITAKVDAGEFRWVWDVTAVEGREARVEGRIRELRFWAKEIVAPQFVARLGVREALAEILGQDRQRFRGTELQHLLLVSRPQIKRLRDEGLLAGEIVGSTLWVNRSVVETFLTKRLVNSEVCA